MKYIIKTFNTRSCEQNLYTSEKITTASAAAYALYGINVKSTRIGIISTASVIVGKSTVRIEVVREDHELASAKMASVDRDLVSELKEKLASAKEI